MLGFFTGMTKLGIDFLWEFNTPLYFRGTGTCEVPQPLGGFSLGSIRLRYMLPVSKTELRYWFYYKYSFHCH